MMRFGNSRRMILRGGSTVYHVINRTVKQQFWFGPDEKEMFVKMLYRQASFCGVEVLTYCIMDNHFHLMVRVNSEIEVSDGLIMKRYASFYGDRNCPSSSLRPEKLRKILKEDGVEASVWRSRIKDRMGDLSVFVKELKQRFGIWYNSRHESKGTIWSDRFKSLIVSSEKKSLGNLWAYINLNPVRAGICTNPADYRWCSYAGMVANSRDAIADVEAIFKCPYSNEIRNALHRLLTGKDGGLEIGKHATFTQRFCNRVKYFTEGILIGSRHYIEQFYNDHPHMMSKRKKNKVVNMLEGFLAAKMIPS